MGVRFLNKWIDFVSKRKEITDWKLYEKTQIGIDILGFLYEAKQKSVHPCLAIANQIIYWRKRNIEPIFVFDGKCPKEKTRTRSIRKHQKSVSLIPNEQKYVYMEDRIDVKQFLYACGCMCLNAEGEADDLLAFLAKKRIISAVVTYDFDILARGCPVIIVPSNNKWYEYNLESILSDAQISYDSFVKMCVLMGCDYCPSLPTISYQRAYWIVRSEPLTLDEIIRREGIRNTEIWQKAFEILQGISHTWNTLLSEKQRMKWNRGTPPVEPTSIELYRTSFLKDVPIESIHVLLKFQTKESDLMHINYII